MKNNPRDIASLAEKLGSHIAQAENRNALADLIDGFLAAHPSIEQEGVEEGLSAMIALDAVCFDNEMNIAANLR